MQLFFIVILLSLVAMITGVYNKLDSISSSHEQLKVENLAGNIVMYNDIASKYINSNYESLQIVTTNNYGKVEHITPISISNLSIYSQKNINTYMDYSSIAFNFTKQNTLESNVLPSVYLLTSWNNINSGIGYKKCSMSEVLSSLNIVFANKYYQTNSTDWIIPIVGYQNGCNIQEIYTPVPRDNNGNSRIQTLKILFNNFCTQLSNDGIPVGRYFFLQQEI